ncbi:hypothetical protein BGZ76_010520 [Entomortierella beljakovae]|nr:hypothetical protein BGZ76_010520 [Entomortierella beljakovae]
MGSCQDWRWFSPNSILQLQRVISKGSTGQSLISELDYDDMYSFGILAWELATEELPFDSINLPYDLSPSELGTEARFRKSPPPEIRRLIQQCTLLDKEKRPSWCDVLQQINDLFNKSLGPVTDADDNCSSEEATVLQGDSSKSNKQLPLPQDTKLSEDKSKVVVLMESTLSSTFYKKELPSHLVSITSAAGRRLFREMILAGTSECFFSLFTAFNTQSDPAFCGVSSLSMVLNALGIDPRRQWRGVWRWYSDEHLDCCASIEEMKQKGITFNQFQCLASCHAEVVAKPADSHTLEEFRRDVQLIASSEGSHMVLSFSRASLGQTGSGHFSPIGGYHAGEDKVLVLDCARFKYPPFYATIPELWESFLGTDPETGKCRGYFLITATPRQKEDIKMRQLHTQMQILGSSTSVSSPFSTAHSSINPSRSSSPIPNGNHQISDDGCPNCGSACKDGGK